MEDIDKRLGRIENKMDQLYELNVEQTATLVRHELLHEKNTDDLATHIKRTNILEEQMQEALKPIHWFKMTGQVLLVVVPVIAAAYSIYRVIKGG